MGMPLTPLDRGALARHTKPLRGHWLGPVLCVQEKGPVQCPFFRVLFADSASLANLQPPIGRGLSPMGVGQHGNCVTVPSVRSKTCRSCGLSCAPWMGRPMFSPAFRVEPTRRRTRTRSMSRCTCLGRNLRRSRCS